MDSNVPDDVIEFAKIVHRAFPTLPLLGTDILREESSGKLYALEVNSNGWTFHIANEKRKQVQKDFGVDLYSQFGGAKAIARGIYQRLFWNTEEDTPSISLFKSQKTSPEYEELLKGQ